MVQTTLAFADPAPVLPPGVIYLPGALSDPEQRDLTRALQAITTAAPLTRLQTKSGGLTSAAMTNCGQAGWWSDAKGYRYVTVHPVSGKPWPPFPPEFLEMVRTITARTPWPDFVPDACLINFYEAGAKMGLHQDKDEADLTRPIVTICLGDDADFLIGEFVRGASAQTLRVRSGDALVMGGEGRMRFHGVRKIYPGTSPVPGVVGRYSFTFRKAL